ncbi:MAG: hypothetical protein QNJ36_05205 [Calothrix sp. MO_167.B42]|nr:hypothetical protein [Calothrix sp. MO_167.B42]
MPETSIKQIPSSPDCFPVLYKKENFLPAEYNSIQGAIKLWATLSDKDTIATYQQAAGKTWQILKQLFAIVLFLLTLIIALTIWMSGIAFQSGQNLRNWLEIKQPNLDEVAYALFKPLVRFLERAYEWSISFIKEHLGWKMKAEHPKVESPPEETTNNQ